MTLVIAGILAVVVALFWWSTFAGRQLRRAQPAVVGTLLIVAAIGSWWLASAEVLGATWAKWLVFIIVPSLVGSLIGYATRGRQA